VALTKTLGRPVLVTGPVAELASRPLAPLGEHTLRGLAEPVAIFGLPG
jgi:adenylate cyclase